MTHIEISKRIDALSATDVRQWLCDRLDNCHRISATKQNGRERDEWLNDAAYFSAAIGLIDWSAATKEKQKS